MRALVATAAAVAMAFVCPAYGETPLVVAAIQRPEVRLPDVVGTPAATSVPTLRLGSPSLGVSMPRGSLVLTPGIDAVQAHLTVVLFMAGQGVKDAHTSLTLPRGARVVGLAVTLGKGARMVGTAMTADDAYLRYERMTNERTDPGLLSLDQRGVDADRYLLRVYPLTSGGEATVEVDIELPPTAALSIDSTQTIASFSVEVAGRGGASALTGARTIAIPEALGQGGRSVAGPAVSERVSLFVDEDPSSPWAARRRPVVIVCGVKTAHQTVSLDKRTIRTEVRRHVDQLRYCYSRELQQRQRLEGSVVLHFEIGSDGKIGDASVDGDLDSEEVKQCLRDQVVQWQFHEQDGVVRVNYPLQLVHY